MVEKQILENEINSLKRKQKQMTIAGIILTVLGAILFVAFLVVALFGFYHVINDPSDPQITGNQIWINLVTFYVGAALASFFELVLNGGIVLIVIPKTVIRKKINSRMNTLAIMDEKEKDFETVDAKVAE